MPNKQITELTEQTSQRSADVLWVQRAAGGASSSFKVAWSNLFKAAATTSEAGIDLSVMAGTNGDYNTDGGELYLGGGAGYTGGNVVLAPGYGSDTGGDIVMNLAGGGSNTGMLQINYLPSSTPGGTNRVWRDAGVLKIT